jgi:hypothetical protein
MVFVFVLAVFGRVGRVGHVRSSFLAPSFFDSIGRLNELHSRQRVARIGFKLIEHLKIWLIFDVYFVL